MMKRWLCLLLILMLLLPAGALADAPVSWLYSFSAGDVLSGEGMDGVRELLDAVQFEVTAQKKDSESMGQAILFSEGNTAFSIRAAASEDGDRFGLACSLTGECTLMCRQDQLEGFLLTIVRMLNEKGILKDESLDQASHLARRAGEIVLKITKNLDLTDPEVGLSLTPYLDRLGGVTSAHSETVLDGHDPECPGAVLRRSWLLSEEDLNGLVDTGLTKLNGLPVISDALRDGRLMIGTQRLTEPFIRNLFASMHGETTLDIYLDPDDMILLARLNSPDISGIVTDPIFSRSRGMEIRIDRQQSPSGPEKESLTSLRLIGLEGSLLSIRMQKGIGNEIEELPDRKVYQVGEMTTDEVWDLFTQLGLTIAKNAVNMILYLPRIVFDTLVGKLF